MNQETCQEGTGLHKGVPAESDDDEVQGSSMAGVRFQNHQTLPGNLESYTMLPTMLLCYTPKSSVPIKKARCNGALARVQQFCSKETTLKPDQSGFSAVAWCLTVVPGPLKYLDTRVKRLLN